MAKRCRPVAMTSAAKLGLALLLAPALAWTAPKPYAAIYSTHWNGLDLTGSRTLTAQPDGSYRLEMVASHWLMRIQESSDFRYEGPRLVPLRYAQHRDSLTGRRLLSNEFDWSRKLAVSKRDADSWQVPLSANTYDRLSYQAELCRAFEQSGGKPVHFDVIDKGKVKDYAFELVARERVRTAIGLFDTLKVQRVRKENDRQTIIWVAPTQDCLLVRLQQLEDGSRYELILREATVEGKSLQGEAE